MSIKISIILLKHYGGVWWVKIQKDKLKTLNFLTDFNVFYRNLSLADNIMYRGLWWYGARDVAGKNYSLVLCFIRNIVFRITSCKYQESPFVLINHPFPPYSNRPTNERTTTRNIYNSFHTHNNCESVKTIITSLTQHYSKAMHRHPCDCGGGRAAVLVFRMKLNKTKESH